MRDRLIELLEEAKTQARATIGSLNNGFGEWYADYLLANGVIVPPCKVGDTVYVIEPCTCYNDYDKECVHRRTKATKWIDIVRLPQKHHKKCLKLFERPFKIEYLNKIGKTVFLSREEAERALEGKK